MNYMIEISEGKVSKMSEYAEKMLKYGGKLMQLISEMEEETGMGHRGGSYGDRYNERSMMGGRYNMRSEYYGERDEGDWDEDEMMDQRRRRSRRTGRYM